MPGLARCLSGALKISTAQKYCRLFINETALLRPIIERSGTTLARDGAGTAQLQRLLRSTAAPAPQASSGLLSELTKREIRILRQLESGLTNKEIAESIFISEGTLKWHLHNIYGKLGAKNRSGAIVAARELHLL